MSITFHCEHCGKKIEAPDNSGGKWGKCPGCHNKVYIPNLNPDDDLKLAPIDESDEERKKRLMAETYKLGFDILGERETPDESAEPAETAPVSEMNEKELTKNVIICIRQMADGELDEAEQIANTLKPHSARARKILNRIAMSDMPEPELADVAPGVLAGLIRTLRGKIA